MSIDRFYVLQASVPEERADWMQIWTRWHNAEVFAHPSYVTLFARAGDVAMCGVAEIGGVAAFIIPFIRRAVPGDAELHDVTGPYGYGGAYKLTAGAPDESKRFWQMYTEWAIANGVVSEFHRLHLFDSEVAEFPGEVVHRSNNVVRDLSTPEEAIWMDFDHKVRKNVKKAQRLGVTITIDEDATHFDAFLRVYQSTMARRSASEDYRFTEEFFAAIHSDMPDSYVYAHAWQNDSIVSSELALISGGRAYSFLGGTDAEFFDARPNDLLKYELIRWLQDRGLSAFVLGGGVSPSDGIERYKAAFAPHGIVPFRTGQRVLRSDDYEKLTVGRNINGAAAGHARFFPAYRAPTGTAGAL